MIRPNRRPRPQGAPETAVPATEVYDLMKFRRLAALSILSQYLALVAWGQQPGNTASESTKAAVSTHREGSKKTHAGSEPGRLHRGPTMLSGEVAESFGLPVVCDADANLYVRTAPDGIQALHKLSSKGERVAIFRANSADVKVNAAGAFALAPNGDLYQLIFALEITRYDSFTTETEASSPS